MSPASSSASVQVPHSRRQVYARPALALGWGHNTGHWRLSLLGSRYGTRTRHKYELCTLFLFTGTRATYEQDQQEGAEKSRRKREDIE
eukprot:scaffold36027_cov35-Prasinocladus_malaysianus.AAC.2